MRRSFLVTLLAASILMPVSSFARTGRRIPGRAEERIEREVRHGILMLPEYNVFDNIGYRVEGYNVILVGEVTQPILRRAAENVVNKIEGVERVDNQIEVLPTSKLDDQLRFRLYYAIYGYPALQHYAMPVVKPIRIIVKNGHVDLEGVVNSEADKNLVNIRANGVHDVFSVTDHLKVVKS